jgi:hypothetical protein
MGKVEALYKLVGSFGPIQANLPSEQFYCFLIPPLVDDLFTFHPDSSKYLASPKSWIRSGKSCGANYRWFFF